jgi:hypothetical protein
MKMIPSMEEELIRAIDAVHGLAYAGRNDKMKQEQEKKFWSTSSHGVRIPRTKLISPEEMLRIMKLYGPELRWHHGPVAFCSKRVPAIRQRFKRWNPNFYDWFYYHEESKLWEPVLGLELEYERREATRRLNRYNKRGRQGHPS